MLSISNIRNFLEKSGCSTIVSIIIGLVFIAGIVAVGFMGNQGGPGPTPDGAQGDAVATVEGEPVTASAIESMAQQQMQMFAQQMSSLPPTLEASTYGYATEEQMKAAALLALAKKRGITLGEEEVIRILAPEIEDSINQRRKELVDSKDLKEGASEAEFAEAYKKKFNQTPAEAKQQQIDFIKGNLKTPETARQILTYSANQAVLTKIADSMKISDEELAKSYDDFVMKRIYLDPVKRKGEDVAKLAEKIVAEVKGGLAFEDAMNKYSDEDAGEGKTKGESTFIASGTTLQLDPEFEPVKKLKVGEILTMPMSGGISIFKLDAIQSGKPEDFDAKKEEYRKQLIERLSVRQMQDELKKAIEGPNVKWQSDGYKVLHDWYRLQSDRDLALDPEKKRQAVSEIVKRSGEALNDAQGSKMALITQYTAFMDLWNTSTAAEKEKLKDLRLTVYNQTADSSPTMSLLFELIDLNVENKRIEAAGERLLQAANTIQNDFTPQGQANYGDVANKLQKLKEGKHVTPEVEKQVMDLLNQWRNDRTAAEKAEAEAKKLEEEDRKRAEAEAKKAEAEAKKDAAKPAAKPEGAAAGGKN